MQEIKKFLGRETFELAEKQAENNASNPLVSPQVETRTGELIEKGHISLNGPTARVRQAAIEGKWFQQLERGGVCMDDVTPEDR